jgi:hypothetical protein
MRAPPARNDHGGPFLLKTISIQIEEPPGRMGEAVKFLNKGLDGVDAYFAICAIPNAIDLLKPFSPSVLKVIQQDEETKLSFSQNAIINERASKYPLRIATDMGPSHNHDPSAIPLLNDLGYLKRLTMIRCKGRGNPEDIRMRTLNLLSDLIPIHAEMVIIRIELERASVVRWVICLQIRKFVRGRDYPLPICLTVEDLYCIPLC